MSSDVCLVLPVFREKVETAVAMVPSMPARDKLQAVQLWNVLSEKLQEIVNNSAADINALAYQDSVAPAYYYVPSAVETVEQQTNEHDKETFAEENQDIQTNNINERTDTFLRVPPDCEESLPPLSINAISSINENIEEDSIGNSLASFSDIHCSDEGDMDGVCLLVPPIESGKPDDDKSGESAGHPAKPDDQPTDIDNQSHKKRFKCSECGASFRSSTHLLAHKRKHTGERPFRCTECGRTFTTMSNLKRHTKSHGGEKQWDCKECNARFLEKKTLLVHMRTHTGEKPYACEICEKRFTQLCVLQSHMTLHDDTRSHLCELCGKAFRQKSQMKTHMLRHKGVRRYSCEICSMGFLTKSDLSRHSRVHSGERPHTCDICNKSFTRIQSLNEHRNRHYGLKPYECKTCRKGFAELSAYKKHEKKHEQLNPQNSNRPTSD